MYSIRYPCFVGVSAKVAQHAVPALWRGRVDSGGSLIWQSHTSPRHAFQLAVRKREVDATPPPPDTHLEVKGRTLRAWRSHDHMSVELTR